MAPVSHNAIRKAFLKDGGLHHTLEDWDYISNAENQGTPEAAERTQKLISAFTDWYTANNRQSTGRGWSKSRSSALAPSEPKQVRRFRVVGSINVVHRVGRREATLLGPAVSHCVTFSVGDGDDEKKWQDVVVQTDGDEWSPKEAITNVVDRWGLYLELRESPIDVAKEFAPGRNAVEAAKVLKVLSAACDDLFGILGERGWVAVQAAFVGSGEGLEEVVPTPVSRKRKDDDSEEEPEEDSEV